jgi:protein O-mannosyl-transferase
MNLLDKPYKQILLIVFLAVSAYSGTLLVPFVLDDATSIVNNTLIKDLANFVSSSAGYASNPRRFIGYLSFALNYRFCGTDVTYYHVVNLAVHIINAVLVYLLVILTFVTSRMKGSAVSGSSGWAALFAATLFAVHPIETQAVTYIVQRLASLTVLFYLCALIFYIKSRDQGIKRGVNAGHYLLSLVFALLAMKTKEISFTLPLIAALYEFLFFEGRTRNKLLYLLPMLLMLFIIPISMLNVHDTVGNLLPDINAATTASDLPRWDYLLTEFSVIVTYLRLLFIPVNQNLDYDYPVSHSLLDPRVVFSLVLLVSLLGAAVFLARRAVKGGDPALRIAAFGIFWFFITLSVESSVIPIQDVIFEHRLYLPSIGIFITVSCLGLLATTNWFAASKAPAAAAVIVVLLLTVATDHRNMVWSSEIGLWKDAVKKSPLKARTHNNLGDAYSKQGMPNLSINEFKAAIKLNPDYGMAHYNLGHTMLVIGIPKEAVKELVIASRLNPDAPDIHDNLGVAYAELNMADKAFEEFQHALRLDPYNKDYSYNLMIAKRELGAGKKRKHTARKRKRA